MRLSLHYYWTPIRSENNNFNIMCLQNDSIIYLVFFEIRMRLFQGVRQFKKKTAMPDIFN